MTERRHYFERPSVLGLVFGAFAFLVVPLAALQLIPNFVELVPALTLFVAVALGTSHFFLTLLVYLDAANLRYFTSDNARRLTYIALPLTIMLLLAWIEAGDLRVRHAKEVNGFFALVRFLDFLHVGRQSFGVLQIMKVSSASPVGGRLLRAGENALFVGLAMLQWQTFLFNGEFPSQLNQGVWPAIGLGLLGALVLGAHGLRMLRDPAGSLWPLLYLVVQAGCAAAAAYRTWLYLTVLAVHYLEYHVIMYPRCFGAGAGRLLRKRAFIVYGLLALLVACFELRHSIRPEAFSLRFLVHIFDGIFLLHYVLDAFLWRMRTPFYRQRLAPLYFDVPPPSAARPPLATRKLWMGAGALVAAVALSTWSGLWNARIFAAMTEPLHARNHARWGVEFAESGDLASAERHLTEAVRRDPSSGYARAALRWVRAHTAGSSAGTGERRAQTQ